MRWRTTTRQLQCRRSKKGVREGHIDWKEEEEEALRRGRRKKENIKFEKEKKKLLDVFSFNFLRFLAKIEKRKFIYVFTEVSIDLYCPD